ncbi:glycoside hydrolase family 99-like domain-containing protein [Phytoactinopolyspora endophytica]|uniref:glycoside hydrolase family 99-like domain-containing protein n=1 Tax=Phytoactinopolyspora endophytica TaxID=1642495 RepID=UPI0013EC724C|nr:glycoside hydrolase family 99-like domain-containing protein [Phytoactinopolyspora endophytica]
MRLLRRRQRRGVLSRGIAAGSVLASAAAMALAGVAPGVASPTGEQSESAEPLPLVELVSASGQGRLYTADAAEARRAAANGMTRSPGQIGFLPREPFTGSKPMYRLKPSAGASKWLFTASSTERDRLVSQGWAYEGVAAYLYSQPGEGLVEMRRFTNGKEWRLALESRTDELKNAGYTVDGPVGYVHENWVRAGAVYFGMFNIDGHQRIIERTEEVYGREGDWWGGVRDFYDGHRHAGDNWPDEDFSHLKPSIGYYDDSDPETLEMHIDQATSAGLSFFNFYWYWDTENQQERVTDAALDAFLAAENKDTIDFTIGFCAHPFGGASIPVEQYGAIADVLVDKYLSQENTLRTNDGRKILNICDARGLGDGTNAQVARFVSTVRATAEQRLGEDIYVMINQGGFDPKQVSAAGGDASYCTTDGAAVETRSYRSYLEGQRAYYGNAPGAYGRCVLSNFDERPRYPIETPDVEAIRWMPDHSLDRFRQAVRNARADMDASTRPPEVDNLLYVYAWNEWHEGGAIEPNERDGCAYLDILRDELSLTRGSGCTAVP